MSMARIEFDATDETGDLQSNVSVEVRLESTNALVSVYSDRAGTVSLGNPFVVADGKVGFHVAGGAYKITLTAGTFTRTLRYIKNGLGAESDGVGTPAGLGFTFNTAITDSDPGAGQFKANHATLASATVWYFSDLEVGGADISVYLDSFDDSSATVKGTLTGRAKLTNTTVHVIDVTGTVIDGTDYRKITGTYIAGQGALAANEEVWWTFTRSGNSGSGSGDLLAANNLSDVDNAATSFSNIKQAASATATGAVELATIAEVDTGTDTGRAITPAGLAGSALQSKVDAIEAAADVTDNTNVTAAGALMDGELTSIASVKAINQSLVTTASPTFVQPTVKAVTETRFAVTGTTPAIDPANGGIQTWALSANSTPTDSLGDGESVTLHIDDGTARTITWTMVDEWIGGSAPTLPTTGYAVIELWKVNTTVYAASLGDLS